jgi:hypothetical protein
MRYRKVEYRCIVYSVADGKLKFVLYDQNADPTRERLSTDKVVRIETEYPNSKNGLHQFIKYTLR